MKFFLFVMALSLVGVEVKSQTADIYTGHILQGISGNGKHKKNPYVAAGDRAYLIGAQNGEFPDMGDHVKGEMAGLWCPPFKLADGFWINLYDKSSDKSAWLDTADSFINYPYGNKFIYKAPLKGIDVERLQFCPDGATGMLVKYTIKNTGSGKRNIKLTFNLKTDIRPVWFTDSVDTDYPDKIISSAKDNFFLAKDEAKPWYLAMVSSAPPVNQQLKGIYSVREETIGKGVNYAAVYDIAINANSSATITFAISGGDSKESALKTSRGLIAGYGPLLQHKINRYKEILNRAKITIPDQHLQDVYNWVKINTDWLTRTVPGIGTGLTAGYMEYPWWFGCDNTYALQGVLATGYFKLAKATLELLYNKSQQVNGNGRIIHESSTSGKVYNKGNTQETAHFIMCAGTYLKWTGDTAFIRKIYPSIKDGIKWLLVTMDANKNMFPEGYGIMEVSGLNAELIDVSVYTQQALKNAAEIATIFNDKKSAAEYGDMADKLKQKINEKFWDNDSQSYCDFYGTKQQALTTLDGAMKQLKISDEGTAKTGRRTRELFYEELKKQISAMPDTSRGWLTNKNWVINTPMETGIAPREIATTALDKIRRENCGEYGPYLSAVEKKYMMTIATGVQAVAEFRYGRIDSAMWYVNRIAATFNRVLPGSISEMMPDYGCFTQAWTNYGIDIPLISYVFGVMPDAVNRVVNIAPVLPAGWANASIKNVKAGDNNLSLSVETSKDKITYTINQSNSAWQVYFKPATKAGKCTVNGKAVSITNGFVTLTGKTNIISAGI